MSLKVHVGLGDRSYDIAIGRDLPIAGAVASSGCSSVMIVSDSNVDPLYGDRCEAELVESGLRVTRAVVPAGEGSKSLEQIQFLYSEALKARLDRKAMLVALGGGMVGDLCGFAAASYLRGIRLMQVPTTLLAMVDSSVGGKTGINLPEGKNLVGAFHQPIDVVADLDTLDTLPARELACGIAEVVKYGVIYDVEFFAMLEKNADAILAKDPVVMEQVVARCCEIKAEVVAQDEREGGLRAILNFGHTLGHVVEQSEGYTGKMHGEAVAVGMAYATMVSKEAAGLSASDADRITALLARMNLPVSLPGSDVSWEQAMDIMTMDKKTTDRIPRFVLTSELGKSQYGCEVSEDILRTAYETLTG